MMKIPKTISVCGKKFAIKLNPKHDGGSSDLETLVIEIGTFDSSEVAENLIHEVGETIMMIRDFRYALEREEPDNGDFRFFLSHQDWKTFSKDLSIALSGIKFDK